MATGTGKTWVLNALLIWQYLNAIHAKSESIIFTKNFLIIAPGLIVYERLIDSFFGKDSGNGERDFSTSDIYKNRALFLPSKYHQSTFAFIQNHATKKDDIGKIDKNDGIIAITNWHLLIDEKEEISEVSLLKDTRKIITDLLPITPSANAKRSLDILDSRFGVNALEFLASLGDICVFNDEAHHIHENKTAGITNEVEWQKSLNMIAKHTKYMQIDFSATPYTVTGSTLNRTKHYFPHIICDFGLKEAIYKGLVKLIVIDKRSEFASIENEALDFKALRDEATNEVIDVSDGQRLMISAGLAKLQILEEQFLKQDGNKHPKMLIVCEDTAVTPKVVAYLQEKGLKSSEIMQIDSDKKGEVSQKEWQHIKQRLFNIDKHENPKVIVSVLMLREGFDVNNICVIVPLRSSQAPILLEQVIGRGLRLMWRESEYSDSKAENRNLVLKQKLAPQNYYDILSIVEHPAYMEFYDGLDSDMVFDTSSDIDREKVLGDVISVGLKPNFKDYDMYIPRIIMPQEEFLKPLTDKDFKFEGFGAYSLDSLKKLIKDIDKEKFESSEITVGTRFGEYKVSADLFKAQNYNDFLTKITNATNNAKRTQSGKSYPLIQVDMAQLVGIVDRFIRNDLFNEPFNPLENDNWRVLMLHKFGITKHILRQINEFLIQSQNSIERELATVQKEYFSQINELKMREKFAINLTKSIYEKTAYPSNKGEFERDFMLFCDKDSSVDKIIKIEVKKHIFASLHYICSSGNIMEYYPDFIIQSRDRIFLIETKAQKDLNNENVKQKCKSALRYIEQINELESSDRMEAKWSYHILDDKTFKILSSRGANLYSLLKVCELNYKSLESKLF